ncbi:hypothetical protein RESH_06299 [Rhodopirellula europaea SH398]|uniref:Uncharacterized protein n=1 Tax=Rhodopirellula europaea SH398 TaxID=1263868 RepID=M5RVA2_9BACT|nr:hypothetical protein RESH_06299 [Rhodopirellula europaea SH398]
MDGSDGPRIFASRVHSIRVMNAQRMPRSLCNHALLHTSERRQQENLVRF